MRVLFLGYEECRMLDSLRSKCDVFQTMKRLKNRVVDRFDWVVSFGYRFLLPPVVLNRLSRPGINCHISYLPWNRGADPNFWSFYDNTPKGVSIHEMDEGCDTGPLIVQKKITFTESESSLASTYRRLFEEIQDLFIEKFDFLISGNYETVPQSEFGIGTHHSVGEMPKLPDGWNTPVSYVCGLGDGFRMAGEVTA